MERINPSQLMVRIVPFQKTKRLSKFCNSTDRAEFEHNLSQQIYFREMLVYYCYRKKRDNPNDAFG
jgi:hypothetical protein